MDSLLTPRADVSQDFLLVRRVLISMSLCGSGRLAARAAGVGLGRCWAEACQFGWAAHVSVTAGWWRVCGCTGI